MDHTHNHTQKRMISRLVGAAILLIAGLLLPGGGPVRLALLLASYAVAGWDILWQAIRNIAQGEIFDENFLMSLATVGALAIGEYPEAVTVMLFYQVGELFQGYAVDRSRRSIAHLMDIRPDYANIEEETGLRRVAPQEVAVGDVILVKPGERIPLDGLVLEGSSTLNTAALTGESLPREVTAGEAVLSGCINLSGLLRIQVSKAFDESTVAKILALIEYSASKKAKAEHFITKFSRYYTPAVVIGAALLAFLGTLLGEGGWSSWVHRALTFLVVSCPCALVLSIPLSFFGGIGGASKRGILIKGGNYMEALAKAQVVVFDKTGTLTRGTFQVTHVHPNGVSQQALLELAALAEQYSDHPISRSLKEACPLEPDAARIADVEEIPGRGVRAKIDGREVYVGNAPLMETAGVPFESPSLSGTAVHVAADGLYLGYILISDQVREDAAAAIQSLRKSGIQTMVMLTGDSRVAGEEVATALGLDAAHTQLLPGDKLEKLEALLEQVSPRRTLVFVGDGINDAPALSRADVGIAMGGLGSDAAMEAADVVLMDDRLSKLAAAIQISRKTLNIAAQNIVFALGVKALVLVLGAMGMANMWGAVFADVGVSVLAVLNATRALNVKETAP